MGPLLNHHFLQPHHSRLERFLLLLLRYPVATPVSGYLLSQQLQALSSRSLLLAYPCITHLR
uniref:Uncharacterized protein n=1 Tax=Brassica oleracea TaxID=3712 RepID=A0A3P6DUC1_BRAOL|nr:unnamed protein product [Brassica oleracea]